MENTTSNEKIYLIGIGIITAKIILDSSSIITIPGMLDNLIVAAYLVCMIYKYISQSFNIIRLIFGSLLGVIGLYTCIHADNFYLVFTFFAIFAMQGIDTTKVVDLMHKIKTAVLVYHVLYYILIYFTNPSSISFVYRDGVKRHFFFMGHANTFTAFLAWTSLEYIYVRYEKITALQLFVIWLINLIFFQFTDSNTGMIVITMTIVMIFLVKCGVRIFNSILRIVAKYGFAACSIFFAFVITSYTSFSGTMLEMFNNLNEFFTGRLAYGVYVYNVHGLSYLGRTLTFPSKISWGDFWFDGMVFDNAYIWMLVLYGSFYLVLLSAAYIYIGNKTNDIEKILIFGYVFYAVMESYALNVVICFPLLFIGKYIFISDEKRWLRKKRLEKALKAVDRS